MPTPQGIPLQSPRGAAAVTPLGKLQLPAPQGNRPPEDHTECLLSGNDFFSQLGGAEIIKQGTTIVTWYPIDRAQSGRVYFIVLFC